MPSFKNNFVRTIPGSLRLASLMSLLMVSAATAYSIDQIHRLKASTESLLLIAIPLKESTHDLADHLKQTEFLLHKFMALKDPIYFAATLNGIEQEKKTLGQLIPLLKDLPEIRSEMEVLHSDIKKYWKRIYELKDHSTDEMPLVLENIVKVDIKYFNDRMNAMAKERAALTMNSAKHVTNVLLLLVAGTVIFGIGISLLYAVAAIRPMQRVHHALKRIGEGQYDKDLNLEGLQELRDLSHDVNNMQTKLRKIESAKSEFLSMISHELKTPLASFQSGIDLLSSGSVGVLSPSQGRVVAIMQKQTLQLETSIQEMLDMQSIKEKRLVIDIRPSCLNTVVLDAIERISPLIAKKNQHIEKVGMSADIQAFIDPERTRQILLNLLSNANKYTPQNSQITVTLQCHTEYAEIIVEDEGPGIANNFLDKVCERFFQVPTAGAHLRGTGLGLAIVKHIVDIQNGILYLQNRTQVGLRVRVLLPLYNIENSSSAVQNTQLSTATEEAIL